MTERWSLVLSEDEATNSGYDSYVKINGGGRGDGHGDYEGGGWGDGDGDGYGNGYDYGDGNGYGRGEVLLRTSQ